MRWLPGLRDIIIFGIEFYSRLLKKEPLCSHDVGGQELYLWFIFIYFILT
jgi:hypothetical protein